MTRAEEGMWRRWWSAVKGWLFAVGLTAILFEVGVAVLAETDLVFINTPDYTWSNERIFFHADIDSVFGVWHPANISYVHSAACFAVRYETNAYGARDRPRERQSSSSRIVVLGDSFVEGFGVRSESRFTDRLEQESGIPHLNFGTAGYFGTAQYTLLYETLASEFDHDIVIVAILPLNDFLDDDLDFGKAVLPERYRPYWVGDYPEYEVVYHQPHFPKDAWRKSLDLPAQRLFLHRFTYSYNLLGYVKKLLVYRAAEPKTDEGQVYSGYFDYTPEQFMRMRYSLERIQQRAIQRGAKVHVVTLPAQNDHMRYDGVSNIPLAEELRDLADSTGFSYLDLLPFMHEQQWQTFFHSCDPHWNVRGHEVAAKVLATHLELYN